VFGEPYLPPVSDGSGQRPQPPAPRRPASARGRLPAGRRPLRLPDGKPFEIEFLDFQSSLQPHTQPFQANLKRLGIEARSRIVDAAQYRRRMDDYEFDMASQALGGAFSPGDFLRVIYGSKAGALPGSRNIAGIADPAVDALIELVARADTREKLNVACRALDRVLRAGRYWVPMWHRSDEWLAYWDQYSRPETKPKYATGAPGTWWFDPDKARRIGRA
jgi:microcin C transport system substrate-binding protein